MSERLRPEEAACFEIFRRVTGQVVTPHDHSGRQGVVDGMLTYPDGRTAAVEVTTVAEEGRRQLDNLLRSNGFKWVAPQSTWRWVVSLSDPADVPRARDVLQKVITACEAAGVSRPELLDFETLEGDADLLWAAEGDAVFHGMAMLQPEVDEQRSTVVYVHPEGVGGRSDESLETFNAELCKLLAREHVAKHIAKVGRANTDERHLMIVLHLTALPFPIIDSFMSDTETLPPETPSCLTERVTHLWLIPEYGRRVFVWDSTQWQQHRIFDEP